MINRGTIISADLGESYTFTGNSPDVGAYEYVPSLALNDAPANRAIHLTWDVDTTLPVTITWHITTYSQTVTAPLTRTGTVSPTRAYTLTELTNHAWYTITLNAMLDSTPLLTGTVRVMPTDIFVYLPLVMRGA